MSRHPDLTLTTNMQWRARAGARMRSVIQMILFSFAVVFCTGGYASSFNQRVLDAISEMPQKGDYAVTRAASEALSAAIQIRDGSLRVQPSRACPSYCSGATYLVFLIALENELHGLPSGNALDAVLDALRVAGQTDGVGVWGRWNANGPGMAKFFKDTGIGRSFWDGEGTPAPGDFLKLWWKDPIGKDEFGHSVVFLGYTVSAEGEKGILAWSSHKPFGYGTKFFPYTKIRHALFSRCEHPERIHAICDLDRKDLFLADMLRKNFPLSAVKAVLKNP
jgi:hypothetical protein